MKKTISIIFAVAMLFSGCGDNTSSESDISESSEEVSEVIEVTEEIPTERIRDIESITDFEYEILDGGVTITKYTGNELDVVIPDTIEDVPVTKIGFYAFEAQFNIESVILPDTIEVICENAFMDCSSMKSINLPETLTEIERGAFVACTSLESLVIPASTISIEMEAFTACESMTSLTVNNPELKYEDWGLESIPSLTVYADEKSDIYKWAFENGINVSSL
ncbi:MAG: leucine-rich repeat domain-containing protein [Ruminococcus sp.]|nr:leucine-rich repeat domain-containing protein [Ruminococcus sp.]MDE6789571.1 leucine-rich repeat domain-containing protein [Ruminococcus sp.]